MVNYGARLRKWSVELKGQLESSRGDVRLWDNRLGNSLSNDRCMYSADECRDALGKAKREAEMYTKRLADLYGKFPELKSTQLTDFELPVEEEVVDDSGIWAVRYKVIGKEVCCIHAESDGIAGAVYEYAMRTHCIVEIDKEREEGGGYFDMSVNSHDLRHLRSGIQNAIATTIKDQIVSHVVRIDINKDDRNTWLTLSNCIDVSPDTEPMEIYSPKGMLFVVYKFLRTTKNDYVPRDPTPEEVALLNKLSKHAPKEGDKT